MLKKYFKYLRTLGTLFVDLRINDAKKEGKKIEQISKIRFNVPVVRL